MVRMRVPVVLALALLPAACRSPGWNGSVSAWGSMRAVMLGGETQGRVALDEAVRSRGCVGLGALEGLQGEIAVVDGVAWVARVEGGRPVSARGARTGDRATLLALADVRAWRAVAIESDVAPDELDALLASEAERFGLADRDPWPFVIEGELADVETHVLNGQCPFAGSVDPDHEPFRRSFVRVRGRLVGFYAPRAAGELVHHGQATHAHLVVEEPEPYVGHVDSAAILAGSRLLLPAE